MNRIILFLAAVFYAYPNTFAQPSDGRMLFVIDSIPVFFTPYPLNDLWEEDIASRSVVKNEIGLQLPGASAIDSITYIFTKEYVNRPDSLKQLPSLKQMEIKDSAWHLHGTPYTGKYLDYYYSGRRQTEGNLLNGKQEGEEINYFQNGRIASSNHYNNGKRKGSSISFYKNGGIQSKGTYNREIWQFEGESYFPNGVLESRSTQIDTPDCYTSVNYYYTGKIRYVMIFKDSKLVMDSAFTKSIVINKKIDQMKKAANKKEAKKIAAEIIALDSTNVTVYGNLGFFLFDRNDFKGAIAEFDKVLEVEPFSVQFLFYRAYARIRKTESKFGRPLPGDQLYLFGNPNIPAADVEKICSDLQRADALRTIYGYYSFDPIFVEISKKYCGMDIRR